MLGDSYSESFYNIWQNGVQQATGATLGFQDARAGRRIEDFLECYGGSSTGTNQGASLKPGGGGWGTCAQANTGTVGNTFAQDIAGLDLLLVELGTNDNYAPALGSLSDPAGTESTYGAIRLLLETVQAVKPTLRIVWINVLQVGSTDRVAQMPGIAQAIREVCRQYGVPVVDMFGESGINKLNWQVYLNSDLLHPSTMGFNKVYVPMVVQRLNQFSPTD